MAAKSSKIVNNCHLIILRGTCGSGKSHFAKLIKTTFRDKYRIVSENVDKYMAKNISLLKASNYMRRELLNASKYRNNTIVIMETYIGGKHPFGIKFEGWNLIEYWPNYDEDNKTGYLAWSLVNALKCDNKQSPDFCRIMHKKRAVNLGLYDHAFSKLTEDEIYRLADQYAETLSIPRIDII
jgi:hypothetical protein